jgi:hypothetical protein
MLTITYSGRSKPSAMKIAEASEGRIRAVRREFRGALTGERASARYGVKHKHIKCYEQAGRCGSSSSERAVPMPTLVTATGIRGLHLVWADYRLPHSSWADRIPAHQRAGVLEVVDAVSAT